MALEVITPRDSANGKRFAIRAPGGAIIDAYGFDLTPIVARKGEWASAIFEATSREAHRRRSFDLLTVRRRAVSEALSALLMRFPQIEVSDLVAAREALERDTPRRRDIGANPDQVLEAWGELQAMAEDRFYQAASAGNLSRHIEQNTGSPSDPCTKGSQQEPGPDRLPDPGLVASACPVAIEFGVHPKSELDVIEVGRLLRGGIGAHPSAWAEACDSLGAFRASVLVLIVAQIHNDEAQRGEIRIKNPGGYFRRLVRLCAEGRYGIEAELMAMRRRKMT